MAAPIKNVTFFIVIFTGSLRREGYRVQAALRRLHPTPWLPSLRGFNSPRIQPLNDKKLSFSQHARKTVVSRRPLLQMRCGVADSYRNADKDGTGPGATLDTPGGRAAAELL